MECASNSKASGDPSEEAALRCAEALALPNAPAAAPELTARQTRSVESSKAARGLLERVLDEYRLLDVLFKERNLAAKSYHNNGDGETVAGSEADANGFRFLHLPAETRSLVYAFCCGDYRHEVTRAHELQRQIALDGTRDIFKVGRPHFDYATDDDTNICCDARQNLIDSRALPNDILLACNEYEIQRKCEPTYPG